MGQLTVAITATTTVNGAVNNLDASASLPAKNFSQQTRDFVDMYEQITDGSASYVIVCNVGEESLFVQVENTGPAYFPFEVVSGAHVAFPTSISDGTNINFSRVNMRSATAAGSRAIIIAIYL